MSPFRINSQLAHLTGGLLLAFCANTGGCAHPPASASPPEVGPATPLPRGVSHQRGCALLVGIDQYGHAYTPDVPARDQWTALNGTSNDLFAMRSVLETRYGLKVEVLQNAQATLAGVERALGRLATCVRNRSEVALFYFSGHGYQVPDQARDTDGRDELDGLDEVLVLFDNSGKEDKAASRGYLRDDRLAELLRAVQSKTEHAVAIIDSCNSGTAHRGGSSNPTAPDYYFPRGDSPPAAWTIEARAKGSPSSPEAFGLDASAGTPLVMLAAADSHERAYEANIPNAACLAPKGDGQKAGCPMGHFTRALVETLSEGQGLDSYATLMTYVRAKMRGAGATAQTPQLFGDSLKGVLGTGGRAPAAPMFTVEGVPGKDHLYLPTSGVLHGLSKGQVLAVHPLGRLVDPKAPPLAFIVLSDVGPRDSFATLLAKEAGGVPGQSIEIFKEPRGAILATGFRANQSYRLGVAATVDGLTEALKDLPFVEVVNSSDWTVEVRRPGATVACGTDCKETSAPGVRMCTAEELRRAVVLERSGGGWIPVPTGKDRPMDDCVIIRAEDGAPRPFADVVKDIVAALEIDFRRSRLRGLVDLSPNSAVRGDTRVETRRASVTMSSTPRGPSIEVADPSKVAPWTLKTSAHDLQVRACADESGTRECDLVAVGWTNSGTSPAYPVSIVAEIDGSIWLMRPRGRLEDCTEEIAVRPGETVYFGGMKGGQPEGFIFTPPTGSLDWRVIATEKCIDLSSLAYQVQSQKAASRGTSRGPGHPLADLLDAAAPAGSRGPKRLGTDAVGDAWSAGGFRLLLIPEP